MRTRISTKVYYVYERLIIQTDEQIIFTRARNFQLYFSIYQIHNLSNMHMSSYNEEHAYSDPILTLTIANK